MPSANEMYLASHAAVMESTAPIHPAVKHASDAYARGGCRKVDNMGPKWKPEDIRLLYLEWCTGNPREIGQQLKLLEELMLLAHGSSDAELQDAGFVNVF